MKKSIYISLIALAGVLTTSCEDYLDSYSPSSLDEAMIFSNIGLADNAVMGIHVSFAETNSYRGRFLPYYGQNTDLEWFITGEETKPDDAKVGLCNYNAFAGNTEMNTSNGSWSKMYEGIERANLCIQGLRNFGNVDSDPDMAYLLGEALTLRAVYYADLIRAWGDVPARFAPITPETMYSPKSDQDIIYKQLINDLDEAANYVPWPNATTRTTSVERINKAFVKGLRARLCLYAGGYALRRDDKTVRLSNDPELPQEILYATVISDCNDIINFYGGI